MTKITAGGDFANKTAEILLRIKAVHFNAEKPFIFTSGRASPVYIDCRKPISFVAERRALTGMLHDKINAAAGKAPFDYVAGGETAGIAYAAWMAEAYNLPMLYVRKKPKGFGRGAQIEGEMEEGKRALLIEDLTTDGKSKENFVNALRQAGATVDHVASVFFYGVYPMAEQNFKRLDVQLHYLCTWWDMLAYTRATKYFDENTLNEVEKFLQDPESWSRAHGGKEDAAAS
ncbi:MAG: orotate phosphoribosyltransferase [Alphaproteobacteria bacterium]|nr:orotate phosphoribosyltransferase [Alphaproteobacteria bacterium]